MTWGGSTKDFIQLLRVAYTVAKEANPNTTIHLAAVTHWHNEHWFGKFLDALVADPNAAVNNYYFDVATLHIYFQPETVYDLTAHYYRLMHNRDIYKPIWIAETNAAPSQDPAWPVPNAQFNISLEEQAIFIIQAFSLGLAAGAERIAVYKMADTETDRVADPEPFGLVRLDGSRRPAFTAYQVATTYLSGFRGGSWDRRDDISIVTIDRGQQTPDGTCCESASGAYLYCYCYAGRSIIFGDVYSSTPHNDDKYTHIYTHYYCPGFQSRMVCRNISSQHGDGGDLTALRPKPVCNERSSPT